MPCFRSTSFCSSVIASPASWKHGTASRRLRVWVFVERCGAIHGTSRGHDSIQLVPDVSLPSLGFGLGGDTAAMACRKWFHLAGPDGLTQSSLGVVFGHLLLRLVEESEQLLLKGCRKGAAVSVGCAHRFPTRRHQHAHGAPYLLHPRHREKARKAGALGSASATASQRVGPHRGKATMTLQRRCCVLPY
jgi:hypothetical protein